MIYLQVRNEIKLRFVDYCSSVKVYRKILWNFILQNNNEVSTMGFTYQSLLSIPNSMAIQRSKATGSKINIEVKFPHSPILHYAFSFWIEKTTTKNNTLPLGKQICFTIVWDYAEILPVSAVVSVVFHCSASVMKPHISRALIIEHRS